MVEAARSWLWRCCLVLFSPWLRLRGSPLHCASLPFETHSSVGLGILRAAAGLRAFVALVLWLLFVCCVDGCDDEAVGLRAAPAL